MAKDIRAGKLADLVLNYSVSIKEGDRLLVQFDPAYNAYASIIGEKARKAGAAVMYDSMTFDPVILRGFVERANMSEWKEELERRKELSLWCNTRILIDNQTSPNYAQGVKNSDSLIARFNREVIGPYKDVLYRVDEDKEYKVRWNIVGFPGKESAQSSGLSFSKYEDFVYDATIGNDWKKMGEKMKEVKKAFDGAKSVHIVVPRLTDLYLSLKGRGGEICDGKCNMPDGEVFYGPVEDSVQGQVYFQCPTERDGFGVIEGIKLNLEKGKVTKFSARRNQSALEKNLDIDPGARTFGELGIGCNYAIKKAICNTLFDEKIGGSIHLALGESFEQPLNNGGGLNKSTSHWDIVCDLRRNPGNLAEFPGGEIYVDGRLAQKNGVWKI